MRRSAHALVVALGALAAGCSLVYGVDPDRVVTRADSGPPDGGMDAGADGSVDAGDSGPADAGPDGGPDGGMCTPRQQREVSCLDGIDNDCEGGIDCADSDCMATPACCAPDSFAPVELGSGYDAGWVAGPPPSGSPSVIGETTIEFQTLQPTSLFFPNCLGMASGASFDVNFNVQGDNEGHWASLVFSSSTPPLQALSMPDLEVRLEDSGRVVVLRSGSELGFETTIAGTGPRVLDVEMFPGVSDAGTAVLEVEVRVIEGVNTHVVMPRTPFIPLEDLLGATQGCANADGLHVGFMGMQSNVQVTSFLDHKRGECSNPSQFFALREAEDFFDDFTATTPFEGQGSRGEPALAHALQPPTSERFELWADVADGPRRDEMFVALPTVLVGGFKPAGAIEQRLVFGEPEIEGPSMMRLDDDFAREPSIVIPVDSSDEIVGNSVFYAFAQEVSPANSGTAAQYGIRVGSIGFTASSAGDNQLLLDPRDSGSPCHSYRDPSIVQVAAGDFLVFYTCEQRNGMGGDDRDTIGVVRATLSVGNWTPGENQPRLLAGAPGYSARGVSSPEAVLEAVDTPTGNEPTHRLRVWYLARGGLEVRVALGEGALFSGDMLPSLTPVAANPILDADDPILGDDDCSRGCFILSLGVARTVTPSSSRVFSDPRLDNPSYLILVDRSRHRAVGGTEHRLIPLVQTRSASL